MNSIAIFSLENLTDEQKEEFLALSNVGKAVFLESGQVDLYNRLRNISRVELHSIANVWEFPALLEEELIDDYNSRIRVVGIQAFNNLKTGNIDVIWLSESYFNMLSQQPYFIAL